MREIKFRYLCNDIPGNPIDPGFKSAWMHFDFMCISNAREIVDRYGDTLGEYTGIKDCNGKEIYEGDIVKDEMNKISKVIFENNIGSCGCCFPSFSGSGFVMRDICDKFEVIGNIHENPELLEEMV